MGTVHAKENIPHHTHSNSPDEEALKIDFSKIKAKVERVHVDGISRTKDDIIINSVKDVFAGADNFQDVFIKIHEARTNLEDLGCFKNVGVFLDTSKNVHSKDSIDITFEVEEMHLLGANVHTMVGNNNEGSLNTQMKLRNLFGRGELWTSDYSYGSKNTKSFNTTFNKPFHNDAKTVLSSGLFKTGSEVPWCGYKEISQGVLCSLSFLSADYVAQKISLESVWRQLECLSKTTSFPIRENCGHSLKSSLVHNLNIDRRNDAIFPHSGSLFNIKSELAGLGGDVGYLKNELAMQLNAHLFKGVVAQASLKAGHLLPIKNKKCLISDKFFLGGPNSVRGFEMGGIGPHFDKQALGSDMYWASGVHVFTPMPLLSQGGKFSQGFRLHFFANCGNIGHFIFTEDHRKNMETLVKQMRVSFGAGLALNLAGMARVELNYCVPFWLEKGDRPYKGIQIGVSTDFL